MIIDDPIKESPWEDINAQILSAAGCSVNAQSNGSHKPGADLICSLGNFSNKSTQYESNKTMFKVSSYRLTCVCSDKTPGDVTTILTEINRRKNFNYYSIIVRDETDDTLLYDWYLIPADFPALNPSHYTWSPKEGKKGKKKGDVTGWETNTVDGSSMSITFSMSSQLWMNVNVTEDLKKCIIASASVKKGRKCNFIQLHSVLSASQTL